jgi:hypothetical protein
MATFIILAAENADHVRGPSLQPVGRQGGGANPNPVFILNILVLSDPMHVAFWDYLGALPTMDLMDPDFPAAIELPEGE